MAASTVPSFLTLGPRPLVVPAAPAASSGIGTGGAVAIGLGLAVVAIAAFELLGRNGPGWYFPKSSPDGRSVQSYVGPYPTSIEANRAAARAMGSYRGVTRHSNAAAYFTKRPA